MRHMLEEIDRELGGSARWWIAGVGGLLITCGVLAFLGLAGGR